MNPRDLYDDLQDQDIPADKAPTPDDEITAALLLRAQLAHIHQINGVPFYMQ